MKTLIVLAVIAAGFAAWGGLSWWSEAHDDNRQFALDRDAVVTAARQDIARLNTLDSHKVDDGVNAWLAVSTGPLHDQFAHLGDADRKQLAQAGTVTTAQVIDTAVTALDMRAGTAQLIAAVQIDVAPANGQKSSKRNRLQASLARAGQGWKLSALVPVQVGGRS
jgi:Mce-associated membrane protein